MGEDSRVPPLSRRVPGATDRDRPRPAARSVPRKLPESLLRRMQAAIDAAAAERTADPEQAASAEPGAILSRRVPDANGIAAMDAATQPIPITSGSALSGILSTTVVISAQPEPEVAGPDLAGPDLAEPELAEPEFVAGPRLAAGPDLAGPELAGPEFDAGPRLAAGPDL